MKEKSTLSSTATEESFEIGFLGSFPNKTLYAFVVAKKKKKHLIIVNNN